MIKKLLMTLMFSICSIRSLGVTVVNQSTIAVGFRFDDKVINLELGEGIELATELLNKFSINCVGGGSGLFKFIKIDQKDEVFVRTDSFEKVLFKIIPGGEKIRPLSAYETIIIKNSDPNLYDGLSIELYKTRRQELLDIVDISDWKCTIL